VDRWTLGDTPRLRAAFSVDNVLTNPTDVSLSIERPDGITVEFTWPPDGDIVNQSTGVFIANVLADAPGKWVYRFVGTGAAVGASEGEYIVESSSLETLSILQKPQDYDGIRALLGVTKIDIEDDIIDLPTYGPAIESRIKMIVTDWADLLAEPNNQIALRNAAMYGVAATLAESYVKGGTVSLVHKEEPRRNWSEWARIFWNRYEEWMGRSTLSPDGSAGVQDDDYDVPMQILRGPGRSNRTPLGWRDEYPPMWPATDVRS
jgi:hypothetical protein